MLINIEFYGDILIEISADEWGFHWAAFKANELILDSSKQGGFENDTSALSHAYQQIDWFLNL